MGCLMLTTNEILCSFSTLIVGVRIHSENSINIKSCTINGIAIVFEVDVSAEVRIRINGIELDSLMRIKPPVKLR